MVLSLLESYQNCVRANAQSAKSFEQIIGMGVLLFTGSSSLLTIEGGYSFSRLLSIINDESLQSAPFQQQQQAQQLHPSLANEEEIKELKSQRQASLFLRLVRETQCFGELLARQFAGKILRDRIQL